MFVSESDALAVFGVGAGGSITVWQRRTDEHASPADPQCHAFPILAVEDAEAARAFMMEAGATVEQLQQGDGVRYFGFRDPDGNYLEACQVT